MKINCPSDNFKYLSSQANAKDRLLEAGAINETSLNQCASVCNFLKDSCGGFSYDNNNKTCGLASAIDRAKIVPQSGGRTYQKAAAVKK